ncbi:T9SS type A sorting domain-containing protein, partial [Rubrivirga sp.]|uniref:T9SS type A sorting domain-containing protein n=1 Tax=Rubrivirga sp. TaxID=1885344 RepID=UPI003C73745F
LPQQSGSTTGIATDSTARAASPRAYPLGGATSMRIDYGWNDGESDYLIRQYLAGGAPRDVVFDDQQTLRARVFGDGTGVLLRFAIDDGFGGGHEVSPWTTVDWYGWRTVTWDLDADGFGTWIGNGAWDAPSQLRFDSFQLGYDGSSTLFGEVYADDLELLAPRAVANDGALEDGRGLRLARVSPNPAQTAAALEVVLPEPAVVTAEVFNAVGQRVAVLARGEARAAGEHRLDWSVSDLASGVYVVRVTAGAEQATSTFVVAR